MKNKRNREIVHHDSNLIELKRYKIRLRKCITQILKSYICQARITHTNTNSEYLIRFNERIVITAYVISNEFIAFISYRRIFCRTHFWSAHKLYDVRTWKFIALNLLFIKTWMQCKASKRNVVGWLVEWSIVCYD